MPDYWLYASTTLDPLWLPNDCDGWRVVAIWSKYSDCRIVAFYRLTESVWGWIHARLSVIDAKLASGQSGDGKGLPTLAEFSDLLTKLEVIDSFADEHLDPSRMCDALANPPKRLPQTPELVAKELL